MITKLTADQSSNLIELGIDTTLASMYQEEYIISGITKRHFVPYPSKEYWQADSIKPLKPIFTIVDLIKILPNKIEYKSETYNLIYWDSENGDCVVAYSGPYPYDILMYTATPELIDAVYEMIILCIEKEHIKINKETIKKL